MVVIAPRFPLRALSILFADRYTRYVSVTQSQYTRTRYGNLQSSQILSQPNPDSRSVSFGKAQSARHQRALRRANIDARRTEITAILDVPWLPRKRNDRRPSLRICLRSRSSIVACSMKQMHIGNALFGEIGRNATFGLYMYICIYLYIYICMYILRCLRACALPVHAPRHPAAQGIYISKWRWSLAAWCEAALSADRPRDGSRWHEGSANFPRIPSIFVVSRIDSKIIFFFFLHSF